MEHRSFNTVLSMQAYLLQAAVDYWTAVRIRRFDAPGRGCRSLHCVASNARQNP